MWWYRARPGVVRRRVRLFPKLRRIINRVLRLKERFRWIKRELEIHITTWKSEEEAIKERFRIIGWEEIADRFSSLLKSLEEAKKAYEDFLEKFSKAAEIAESLKYPWRIVIESRKK